MLPVNHTVAVTAEEWTIRVEPTGVVVRGRRGETLMAAATRAGVIWPTVCGGDGSCTICWFAVEAGAEAQFAEPSEFECQRIRACSASRLLRDKTVRLACQAKPVGDAVVTKRGLTRP